MTPTRRLPVTPAWNWESLTPGTAPWRAAWQDLGAWVRWYTATYELWQSMPVCWFQHSRLVEELRALRFHHQAVFDGRVPPPATEATAPPLRPSARAYAEWMTTRRDWERTVLGLDPREHVRCSGLIHAPVEATTLKGRRELLRRMASDLTAMLDATAPGRRRSGT